MASEKGLDGLLQELKQNNDENVKPRYKALRLRGPYKTFRELKESFPGQSDELRVFGGAVYEYWDDQHFKTTWIERVRDKVYFGTPGIGEYKWRKFIRLKWVLEPKWTHNEDYTKDFHYWIEKGVPGKLIKANWGDPTSVLGDYETYWNPDPNWTHLDQAIPDFRRREMIQINGYYDYRDVEVEDIDWKWE